MSYRVAVASSDGKYINQHFGRARQFLIFDVNDNKYEFYELRKNDPLCSGQDHNEDQMSRTVELLADCREVLVSQIGPGAIQALALKGIKYRIVPDFIEDVLKSINQEFDIGSN
ncbi:NifB/NifX family molybdenum-iron cluster-binding protein [Desulfosporosinus sp. BICA1-9]|uniref:NifB/NifX family molybdenum-iron cluster-binding protein n=1 Tax=Desulfosporosinus sp. BICA1-9 TaxID=1531958 RepID=UPI00054C509C|nr:NifB/NifX family molybdenum-iron cluster-binding protein [Desulfosporosinus sp. BICA1-9]KJS50365.1 MAG: dinitrogenase iron-molybdenum cofactor biosynthesis protein [Peptococcaceae bacterium BRH_c23]KJS87405.1 MAG: dinitrogenase iron-molybdenum cofactor biosynthesis protein [Desulfosporosinus sp. BICA1-9]HBW34238.1 dinitrogenase iron-molybdenum cofactor biosynthesis protein [Desulfosporosinus sp.]